MSKVVCFHDKDGKRIRIPIYIDIRNIFRHWRGEHNIPTDPSPWRFMEHEAIRPEIIEDLTKLAVLDQLASTLSAERAKPIQAAIRSAVPRDLPNIEIKF